MTSPAPAWRPFSGNNFMSTVRYDPVTKPACRESSRPRVPADFDEAVLRTETASLAALLGDTRVRYRQRKTPFFSSENLIELDLEIRDVLGLPPSAAAQLEIRRLTARLHALDPH